MSTTFEHTACILCSRNCGLRVTTDGGRITSVRGDESHPVSKGYLCQRAARLQHYQEHADRLEHPLRREPDGSFVRLGWDEALADIASGVKPRNCRLATAKLQIRVLTPPVPLA